MRIHLYIAALAAGLTLTGCGKKETQTAAAAEPVPVSAVVLTVTPQTFTASAAVTGSLISNARVDVKAETTGRVIRFDKQEGDRVSAGETVIWVDQENQQLTVRQAESAVQVAEVGLERARVLESHSRAELERSENLLKSGGITERDLKAARIAERDAHAQVALAQAQLGQAKVALDVARKHLRDTEIKAPVSGEIQRKFVNAGAYVEPPTAVFTIVDNRRLELESPVPASDLGPIRAGQKVAFTVNSYPGETFEGRVIEINPAVDAESRSAKVRIQVASGGKLKAGMFAEGQILTGVTGQAIMIPGAAVYRDDRSAKSSYVYVVENGKAARRTVRIGREQGGSLEIAEGLKAGDQLIAEQSIELAEGVRVQPRK